MTEEDVGVETSNIEGRERPHAVAAAGRETIAFEDRDWTRRGCLDAESSPMRKSKPGSD